MRRQLTSFLRSSSVLRTGKITAFRSFATVQSKMVRFSEFGDPSQKLKIETEDLETDLKKNQLLIRMLAAPINPADINTVQGTYGKVPKLPAVGGNEGVGVVEKAGPGSKISAGTRVIAAKAGLGTWRSHLVVSADDVMPVSSDIPVEYAACLSVNPATAYRLLTDFVDLKEGDVIIQNGGSSMVAHCVAQIAKARGIKVITVLRPRMNAVVGEVEERLKSLGSYLVCLEDYVRTPAFKKLISDLPKPKLALNCIGGASATELARHLDDGGVMVTYGGMSRKPILLSTSSFIFKDLTFRGFWMTRWYEKASTKERDAMYSELVKMIQDDKLRIYVETHKLKDWKFAWEASQAADRHRKIILQLSDYENPEEEE